MFVKTAVNYYKNCAQLLHHSLPVSPALHILPQIKGPLLFPGKVACCNIDVRDEDGARDKAHNNNTSVTRKQESVNNNSSEGTDNLSILQEGRSPERLAVSDTGHNRIIVFSTDGRIEVMEVHILLCYRRNNCVRSKQLQNCTSVTTVVAVDFVCVFERACTSVQT
jgi:hypothetical protein